MRMCNKCKMEYPNELIKPMFMNGQQLHLCTICALNAIRKEFNLPDYKFTDERVAQMHRRTLKWLQINQR